MVKLHKRILQGIVFVVGAAIMAYGIFGISQRFDSPTTPKKTAAEYKKTLSDHHSHSHERRRAVSFLANQGDVEAFEIARGWISGEDEALKTEAIAVLFLSPDILDMERALAVLEDASVLKRERLWDKLASTPLGRERLQKLLNAGDTLRPIDKFFVEKALFQNNGGDRTAEQWAEYFSSKVESGDDLMAQKSLLLLIQLNHQKDIHLSSLGRMLYEGRILEEVAPEVVLVVAKQIPKSLDPIYRSLVSKKYQSSFDSLLYSLRITCPSDTGTILKLLLESSKVGNSQKLMAAQSFLALNSARHAGLVTQWSDSLTDIQLKYQLSQSMKQLESSTPLCP